MTKGMLPEPGRYYDSESSRLIYIREATTPQYWDRHWKAAGSIDRSHAMWKGGYVSRITSQFLAPEDGPILEGGCGRGRHLVSLTRQGFQCIGVDYAEETIQEINAALPELDARLGDVRQLQFPDNHFAGYWSLGVIEHFWEGYRKIAVEMARVIRPGGYLFLTFPYMSPLRRAKARSGRYSPWEHGSLAPNNFYQFAMNADAVISVFKPLGFAVEKKYAWDGIKGAKDELPPARKWLQLLYDYQHGSLLIRGGRLLLSRALAIAAGHVMILVLRRTSVGAPGSK